MAANNIVGQSIRNLKGGISQQPDLLRFPEQGTAQINGWSSEAEGLQKRPPSVFKARIDDAGMFGSKPLIHTINRDLNERYNMVFTGDTVRAFSLGEEVKEIRVHTPEGTDYIQTTNPRTDLRCVTIADYTFVVNRTKSIEADTTQTDAGTVSADRIDSQALILCRGGQYGRTLSVNVNGNVATVEMPSGVSSDSNTASNMVKETDAQNILEKFKTALAGKLSGWTLTVGPGYLFVQAPDGQTITSIEVKDGYAGQLLQVVRHEVATIAKLPIEAPNNYIVLVRGDTTKSGDAYYIKYDAVQKVWKETVGWGVDVGIDNSTMPWVIRRDADGSFTFHSVNGADDFPEWAKRKAGDDDTNPLPSFVDQTINDVFLFRNRLGFLSGENIILSRTGRYFDFFPASVANLSDDDAIDVAISHNKVSILKYAVPFNEQLLIWSDQAQFVFGAQGVLSSKSVELNLATEFEVSDYCRPLGLGRSVYYITPRMAYSSMNRYYTVGDVTSIKDSEDVSGHIPFYIPNGAFKLYGSATEDFIALLSENRPDWIYIYKFKFQNESRTQLSWSHWEFGEKVKILSASVIESRIYVFGENDTDLFAVALDLTKNTRDIVSEPYRTYVDFKTAFTPQPGSYDINSNKTVVNPSNIYGMEFSRDRDFIVVDDQGVVTRTPCPDRQPSWNTSANVYLEGNLEGRELTVGFHFEFIYTFSKFLIKQTNQDGSVQSMDTGRLQLRKAWVNFEKSGAFNVIVTSRNRWEADGLTPKPFVYQHSGPKLNSPDEVLGEILFSSGQFKFPVYGNANEMEVTVASSSVNPVSLIGAGWQGVHNTRSSTL